MSLQLCRKCQREIGPEGASYCSHCGAAAQVAAPRAGGFWEPREQTRRDLKRGLGVLIVLGILWVGGRSGERSPDHSSMAGVMCEKFVKDRLRAPSTAKFPLLSDAIDSLGSGRYRVRSHVDAQNGFGATIRSEYVCETNTADAGEHWWPVSVEIVGR